MPASTARADDAEPVADLLRALYDYVARNLRGHPVLAPAVAALYTPVQAYVLGDIGTARSQAIGVYHLITRLRTTDSGLPLP